MGGERVDRDDGAALQATAHDGGVRLSLRVKPRSSRSKVLGVQDGVLIVAVKAAPVAGRANDELLGLLARRLKIRRSDITITAGAAGRRKIVDCRGLTLRELQERLSS